MWWNQLCDWVALQCENESAIDQIQWKSLVSNIPEAAQCPGEYRAFLECWRVLTAEDEQAASDPVALAFNQRLLSIMASTLVHLQQAS